MNEANAYNSLLTEADSRSPGRVVWMSASLRGSSRGHEGEIANIYCATARIEAFAVNALKRERVCENRIIAI